MEVRDFKDTGTYICRPKIPAPSNEEEQTEIDIILGNKVKDPSYNKNQLDKPATDVKELNSFSVEPTETTTPLTSPSKLTTKKSSVTNNQMNVTNSISVNLTKKNFTHLVNEVVPTSSGVENRKYTNFENRNHNVNVSNVIVIQIHLRIIGDGYNTSDNANQTYDNSIEHDDNDWGVDDDDDDDNDDSDDSTDISYGDNVIEDLVTESYRQKRYIDSTTRPSILKTYRDSDPLDNDFNYESFESKSSQHVREIRQVTTRRPSLSFDYLYHSCG
ncbi:WD repeat-containing protein 48 homolog [Lucilia cuprina]|uniref:WD repeat-containing protein 48 homolog n=1 Tax=Lucilia cuprina TaxID=7375 RepID=UPI001F060EA7|nr:WD repeat-containing protein 48 homolog [Lucilia cuprina]